MSRLLDIQLVIGGDQLDLNNLSEDITLKELKEKVSQDAKCNVDEIELIYRGNSLSDDSSLMSVGPGPVTVFVLAKIKEPSKTNADSNINIQALRLALKNAIRLPGFRAAYKRISRASNLQNIIAATPGLSDDPVALAIIQDPDLLIQLCDLTTLRRVVEKHPALAVATTFIVPVIHEEASSISSSSTSQQALYNSYPLEASEDEDMEPTNSSDTQNQANSSSNSPITSLQLAAALASAQSQATSSSAESQATSSSANPPAESSNSFITSQMLGQALGQALATSTPSTTVASTPNTPVSENVSDLEEPSRRLQQMHEMGLVNDVTNLQALQATDWNVQDAINLVFSGGLTDNDV